MTTEHDVNATDIRVGDSIDGATVTRVRRGEGCKGVHVKTHNGEGCYDRIATVTVIRPAIVSVNPL